MSHQTFGGILAALVGKNIQVSTSQDTVSGILMGADETFIRVNTNGGGDNGTERTVTLLASAVAYIRDDNQIRPSDATEQ